MSTKKSQWVQAGGHGGPQQLHPDGKYLLKPCLSHRERDFYLHIKDDKEWTGTGIIPKFYGVELHEFGFGELEFIRMENLMYQYKRPFVLDLKIGTQTWDPETASSKMKKRLVVDSTSTTTSLGVRFSGMERNVGEEKPILYSRYLCTHEVNTRDSLKEYIKLFFNDGKKYRKELVPYFISQLDKMIEVMKKREYKMFSSSVLFVYDSTTTLEDKKYNCKMIDFAHNWILTEEECTVEDGFLFGLNNLKSILEDIEIEFKSL
ncbi:hypothetical protein ENUP19_0241G0028 [Entamoeba nuttalli]